MIESRRAICYSSCELLRRQVKVVSFAKRWSGVRLVQPHFRGNTPDYTDKLRGTQEIYYSLFPPSTKLHLPLLAFSSAKKTNEIYSNISARVSRNFDPLSIMQTTTSPFVDAYVHTFLADYFVETFS